MNMLANVTLIGTPKQCRWAQAIIQELSEKHPDVTLELLRRMRDTL